MSCIDAAIIKALVDHIGMNPDDVGTGNSNLLSHTYSPKDGVGYVEALGLEKQCSKIVWTPANGTFGYSVSSDAENSGFFTTMMGGHSFVVLRYKTVAGDVIEAVYSGYEENKYHFNTRASTSAVYADNQITINYNPETRVLSFDTKCQDEVIMNDADTGFFVLESNSKLPTIVRLILDLVDGTRKMIE